MLKKTLRSLNYDLLVLRSKEGLIGCPFLDIYGGQLHLNDCMFEINVFNKYCRHLCGEMFDNLNCECPCAKYDKRYVKEKFWKYLNEAVA